MSNIFEKDNIKWVVSIYGVIIDWELGNLKSLIDRLPDSNEQFTISCLDNIQSCMGRNAPRANDLNLKFYGLESYNNDCQDFLERNYGNVIAKNNHFKVLSNEDSIWENIKSKLTPQEFVALKKHFEEEK